jgi:hypothetical protein
MAELADAADSKSADLRVLGVRLPLPAPGFDRLALHQRTRPAGIPFNFSNWMASGSLVSPEFAEPS